MNEDNFSIDVTIQSQYSDSPHIKSVIHSYYDFVSPQKDIDLIYDKMINLYFEHLSVQSDPTRDMLQLYQNYLEKTPWII